MFRSLCAAGALALAVLLAACGEPTSPPVAYGDELIVLTRAGQTTYTLDESTGETGFEYDLLRQFAEEAGYTIRLQVAHDDESVIQRLRRGEAHLGVAWLTPDEAGGLQTSPSFFRSRNVVVQHEASLPVERIEQLAGKNLAVIAGSRQEREARRELGDLPGFSLQRVTGSTPLELLAAVAAGRHEAALVDASVFALAANYYPVLQRTLEVGPEHPIVWLYPAAGDGRIAEHLNAFFDRITADGSLARLRDRHFGHVERLDGNDVSHFIERIRSTLPQYRRLFHEAQVSTGIDWRLLAALAYQESQWNPLATSPTGVRGMMMLTADTADHLRVSNRLDAAQSIRAGAQYFAQLRDALPKSVPEPDRTWMAAAAYNLGMGHLNGARAIAVGLKKDPDSWFEMKTVLPLLARPEYYRRLKSGKARGGEAVILAENVRIFYDILSRHEAPYRPFSPEQGTTARTAPVKKDGAKKAPAARTGKPAPVKAR